MTTFSSCADLLAAITAQDGASGQEILNPATGEVVGVAPLNTAADAEAAVDRARAAQKDWDALGEEARNGLLLKVADAIEANAEPLAELLSREQGKPLNGPNARFEVGACAAWLRATASFESPNYTAVEDDITAKVYYRPLGVVGAIGPWNWPMMITVWQFAPALRMGNTVVVKPSEYTPLSVLALVAIANSVLPADVLQVVTGDGSVGAAITSNEKVDKIMFTGSTATGKKILEHSASTLPRITLELGGNDAGIVLDDADPAAIAGDLFWGGFINTGQTCAAMKRLYVPASLYDAVCEALVAVAQASPMGVGLDEDNVLGPLQNKQQFDIVDRLVKAAKDSGARILIGGDPDYDAPGYFFPTTLVADIDPDNPLVVEEQFGPALPIIKYDDLDWAIEQANRLDVGLGSSVWSSNRERALEVAQRLEAGTTWINSHGSVDPRVPFGGIKSSGYGVEFGTEGLKGLAYPHIING
ncbi:aldehyde dehydrogenase family protein [uncultured Corynebacterium sp.]|uniref:aldehyde dehydrogenase family protein n=1 Tax=uncultured Corynebacterium sp. TaxID=159447 RepID=UPI0025D6F29B|nr:aldehyde dehydrogenase family protein [uncultured Corynebacterium sp.]